jgi:hypothetical protein
MANAPPGRRRSLDALVRPLKWTAGAVSGFLSAALTPGERRQSIGDRWRAQWLQWVRRLLETGAGGAADLHEIRTALLGRTKNEVVALLGPPPATSAQPLPATAGSFWGAQTWYYPLSESRRCAVAITFSTNTVQSVESLSGPPL